MLPTPQHTHLNASSHIAEPAFSARAYTISAFYEIGELKSQSVKGSRAEIVLLHNLKCRYFPLIHPAKFQRPRWQSDLSLLKSLSSLYGWGHLHLTTHHHDEVAPSLAPVLPNSLSMRHAQTEHVTCQFFCPLFLALRSAPVVYERAGNTNSYFSFIAQFLSLDFAQQDDGGHVA